MKNEVGDRIADARNPDPQRTEQDVRKPVRKGALYKTITATGLVASDGRRQRTTYKLPSRPGQGWHQERSLTRQPVCNKTHYIFHTKAKTYFFGFYFVRFMFVSCMYTDWTVQRGGGGSPAPSMDGFYMDARRNLKSAPRTTGRTDIVDAGR